MKKIVLLLVVCSIGTLAYSQGAYLSGFHFGVNATYNTSAVIGQHNYGSVDYYNHKYTPGITGGVSASLSISDIHEFDLEILYSSQGQNYSDVHLPDPTVLGKKISLSYLKVPLTYKYKMWFDSYDAASPMHYFRGGIYSASLIKGTTSYTEGGASITFVEGAGRSNTIDLIEPAVNQLFLPIDFGIVLGYGLEFPLAGDLSLTAELRSEIGLVDINALAWRFPNEFVGYVPSINTQLGLRVGLVYNLFI